MYVFKKSALIIFVNQQKIMSVDLFPGTKYEIQSNKDACENTY